MQYLEFTFYTKPCNEIVDDVLSAELAEIGFDSFVHTEELDCPAQKHAANPENPDFEPKKEKGLFRCYIQKSIFNEALLHEALSNFPLQGVEITYTVEEAEDKDWNEEWEKNYFKPLIVDGRCVIASTFHKNVPTAEYQIFINPQMSFGTGHHATTSQMISRLLAGNMEEKRILDMGCGTGILAILARLRGAKSCLAVDIDEWCVKNACENIALNHLEGIDVELGDATSLGKHGFFDVVIANINLGILLRDMKYYTACMKSGAIIYMSGFYDSDAPQLLQEAAKHELRFVDQHTLDDWACLKFEKI